MKKKIILLSVDHRWRDLPGYAYLAYVLEHIYNHKVILVRNYDELKYWRAFRPNVIIINHLLENHRREWIKKIPREMKVVILPTEGITAYTKDMVGLLGGNRKEYALISAFLSWVSHMKEYWYEGCFFEKDRIFEVGIPRFDFFFDRNLRVIFQPPDYIKRRLKIPQDKKIITFFLNFVYATVAYRDINTWEKILINQGYDPEPFLKKAYKEIEARDNFVRLIKEALHKFPNLFFLIKPHPNEDFLFYKKEISAISTSIKLIPNLYSIEALGVSDLVIQRRCTTGLEAAIMDKLAIDYDYGVSDIYDGDLVEGIWPEAKNKVELWDLIARWQNNDFYNWSILKEKRKDRLQKWVMLNKGKATLVAAEIIDRLIKNTSEYNVGIKEEALSLFKYYLISFLKDIYRKVFPDKWGRYHKAPNFFDFWIWRRKVKKIKLNVKRKNNI